MVYMPVNSILDEVADLRAKLEVAQEQIMIYQTHPLYDEYINLQAQIDKMKNCDNCQHVRGHRYCIKCDSGRGEAFQNWKMREGE